MTYLKEGGGRPRYQSIVLSSLIRSKQHVVLQGVPSARGPSLG